MLILYNLGIGPGIKSIKPAKPHKQKMQLKINKIPFKEKSKSKIKVGNTPSVRNVSTIAGAIAEKINRIYKTFFI